MRTMFRKEVTTMAWHGDKQRHSEAAIKTWRKRKAAAKKVAKKK